jgi:hypothetical protein
MHTCTHAAFTTQALLVHSTGMSLCETLLSFKNLNTQLAPAGKPALFAFRTTALDIESLIGLEEGIFGVVSYHGHREDVRDVHSDFVRDCYQQQQIELIPHFVTFNLYRERSHHTPTQKCETSPPGAASAPEFEKYYGLEILYVRLDGLWQFAAVSRAVYGCVSNADELRRVAVLILRRDANIYRPGPGSLCRRPLRSAAHASDRRQDLWCRRFAAGA